MTKHTYNAANPRPNTLDFAIRLYANDMFTLLQQLNSAIEFPSPSNLKSLQHDIDTLVSKVCHHKP